MNRTVSSDSPLGALSDSITVSNPYRYWSTSIRLTRSTVSCTAAIPSSARGFKDRGGSIPETITMFRRGNRDTREIEPDHGGLGLEAGNREQRGVRQPRHLIGEYDGARGLPQAPFK